MTDTPNIAEDDLVELTPEERLGFDLALDALRDGGTGVETHDRATRGIVTGLAALGRLRIRERAEGPVPTTPNAARDVGAALRQMRDAYGITEPETPEPLTTLDQARDTLRRHVIAAVDDLDRGGAFIDETDTKAAEVLALAKAYVALGGDLADTPDAALEAEVRVRELEQAARAIIDAVDDRTRALLYDDGASVLQPLGVAVSRLRDLI